MPASGEVSRDGGGMRVEGDEHDDWQPALRTQCHTAGQQASVASVQAVEDPERDH